MFLLMRTFAGISGLSLLMVVAAGTVTGCDDSSVTVVEINRRASSWDPSSVMARLGDRIVWRNADVSVMQVRSDRPVIDSKVKNKGEAFEWAIPADHDGNPIQFRDDLMPLVTGTITIKK